MPESKHIPKEHAQREGVALVRALEAVAAHSRGGTLAGEHEPARGVDPPRPRPPGPPEAEPVAVRVGQERGYAGGRRRRLVPEIAAPHRPHVVQRLLDAEAVLERVTVVLGDGPGEVRSIREE